MGWHPRKSRLRSISLEPYRALFDSFRTMETPGNPGPKVRYTFTWKWPEGRSVLPERDWMALTMGLGMTGRTALSRPDALQEGIRDDTEGRYRVFSEFKPALGIFSWEGGAGVRASFQAQMTLYRRDGQDLRIEVDHSPPVRSAPTYRFTTAWPAQGIVIPGQVLRLAAAFKREGSGTDLYRELPGLPDEDRHIRRAWNGDTLSWPFPYPVVDTLTFRLAAREETSLSCPGIAESPELKVIPDPADSTVAAFEPDDRPNQAALIPEGRPIRGRRRPISPTSPPPGNIASRRPSTTCTAVATKSGSISWSEARSLERPAIRPGSGSCPGP